MNKKLLILPLIVLFQVGCSTSSKYNISPEPQKGVRTLHDGTFIIRNISDKAQTKQFNSRYFQYHSGTYAHSIGCKSYSQIELRVREDERAYKCRVGGQYTTKNSIALSVR